MATADYEAVLQQARRLPLEEQRRLREALVLLAAELIPASSTSGADLIAALSVLEPLEHSALDEMERIIEAGCERNDADAW